MWGGTSANVRGQKPSPARTLNCVTMTEVQVNKASNICTCCCKFDDVQRLRRCLTAIDLSQTPWQQGTECVARYNFTGTSEQDLPFNTGDVLTIVVATKVRGHHLCPGVSVLIGLGIFHFTVWACVAHGHDATVNR